MTMTIELFTVQQAAEQLGFSDGYIRRICIDHKIGTKMGGIRLLTDREIEQIREMPRIVGRPPRKS